MDIYGNPYSDLCNRLLQIAEKSENRQELIQAVNAMERLTKRIQQLELENKT
jgi:hypothetical protein